VIGFFTDPYPDELFYSACARFGAMSKYRNGATVARELFGMQCGSAVVSFPNRLAHFISLLPPGHKYTVDRLIDDHTPLRFYSPFVEAHRIKIIRREMRGRNDNRISSRLAINASGLSSPDVLRFCPSCARFDRERHGETYWHRLHQLPGVLVCVEHRVFLEPSSAGYRRRENFVTFVPAENVIENSPVRELDPENSEHQFLLRIALDAKFLLEWRGRPATAAERQSRYYNLLLRRSLAYYKGRFRHSEIIRQFREFYPSSLLTLVHSQIGNQSQPWPLRILRQNRVNDIQPPVRHLLLMTFLEYTAKQFFTEYKEYKPFGNSPWPCLNRASDHFKKNTVRHCDITNGQKKQRGRPVSLFVCDCGFRYVRTGPDCAPEDRLRFDKVISYGSVWEGYFERGWNDPSITLTDLAEKLGVIPFTLRRHAIRLKLTFPRAGRRSRPTSQKIIDEYSRTRPAFDDDLTLRRRQWLTVRHENPDATRQQLIEVAPYLYYWLNRHSIEWLKENLPIARINKPEPIRVDWNDWDRRLSETVKMLAIEIRNLTEPPIRVSKEEIIRRLGHRAWIEQSLHKLPLTKSGLAESLESRETFLIRRVQTTTDYFQRQHVCPTRHQFEVRAGTRTMSGRHYEVRVAIERALKTLQQSCANAGG
jgi:hypothetical protein